MKVILKTFAIFFFLLVALFIWFGLVTKYDYIEMKTGTKNIELINNSNLKLSFGAGSHKDHPIDPSENFGVGLVFSQPLNDIIIDKAIIRAFDPQTEKEYKLQEVNAMDGYYNWVEEKSGKAASFNKLPDHLKTVNKSLEAYYVYNWQFTVTEGLNPDRIKVIVALELESGGEKYEIQEERLFELTSELFFRNPIRFH